MSALVTIIAVAGRAGRSGLLLFFNNDLIGLVQILTVDSGVLGVHGDDGGAGRSLGLNIAGALDHDGDLVSLGHFGDVDLGLVAGDDGSDSALTGQSDFQPFANDQNDTVFVDLVLTVFGDVANDGLVQQRDHLSAGDVSQRLQGGGGDAANVAQIHQSVGVLLSIGGNLASVIKDLVASILAFNAQSTAEHGEHIGTGQVSAGAEGISAGAVDDAGSIALGNTVNIPGASFNILEEADISSLLQLQQAGKDSSSLLTGQQTIGIKQINTVGILTNAIDDALVGPCIDCFLSPMAGNVSIGYTGKSHGGQHGNQHANSQQACKEPLFHVYIPPKFS